MAGILVVEPFLANTTGRIMLDNDPQLDLG